MRLARILTAAFLVCSVVLSAIGMSAGRAVRAAAASLALTPGAILQGADRSLVVSGRDFTPDSLVTLRFDEGALTVAPTDGSGSFTASVAVPAAGDGAHMVRATDTAGVSAGRNLHLVSLSLSSSSAPVGSPVAISGAGFLPSQPLIVQLSGITVLTGATSASGTFNNLTFVVPSGLSGPQVLTVHNGDPLSLTVRTTLLVGQASLLLQPGVIVAGNALHVSGAGYAANAALTLKLDDRALGVVTTNAAGAFGPTAFALPADLTNGQHQVSVQGSSGQVLARAILVVHVPAAALTITPNTGVPGTPVTVTGSGFVAGEAVLIAINGSPVATAVATAQGQIRATFALPAHLPVGSVAVQASGQSSHRTAMISLPVASPARVSLSNGAVRAGDPLTISGAGFVPHELVRLSIPDHVATTVAADGQGAFIATVTIPVTARSASVQVSATGQQSQRAASAALAITAIPAGITISAGAVHTLGSFTVEGSGFHPGEQVLIGVSGNRLATATANERGAFAGVAVTLPSSIVPGAVTVIAAGQNSQKTAGANLTVLARTGSLSITPSAFTPGATVRIEGSGFAPRETVALAVQGGATFATVVADADGRFIVGHALPANLEPGSIRITATGLASRAAGAVSAHVLAPAPAPAPVSTGSMSWYFVGGRAGGGYGEQIVVLNPNDRPVLGTITFNYGGNGSSVHRFELRAQARGTYDVNQLVGNVGRVAGTVQTNLPVVAARTTVGGHGEMMPASAATAPSRTWYMAEGYTGLTFQEELDLFNPGDQPAQVRVTWPLFNGKPAVTQQMTLAPHTQRTISVNAQVDRASHATMVESDQPVVAGRTMLFGARQQGAFTTVGATSAGITLYFAEGSTNNGFEQFLTILNPDGSRAAQVTASFFDRQGNALGSRSLIVEPMRRATIKVNEVTRNTAIATMVQSSSPIVAERAMYFGAPNGGSAGGTVVFGQATPALGWSFASGDTRSGNSQFELLFNPNGAAAAIEALYYTEDGQVVRKTFTLPGHARLNIDVTRAVPELPRGYHGVILRSTNGVTFVAEQAIYGQGLASGGALTGTPVAA